MRGTLLLAAITALPACEAPARFGDLTFSYPEDSEPTYVLFVNPRKHVQLNFEAQNPLDSARPISLSCEASPKDGWMVMVSPAVKGFQPGERYVASVTHKTEGGLEKEILFYGQTLPFPERKTQPIEFNDDKERPMVWQNRCHRLKDL